MYLTKNNAVVAAICLSLLLSGCGAIRMTKGTGTGIGVGTDETAGAPTGKKMDTQKQELENALPGAAVKVANNGEALKVTFDSGMLFAANSNTLNDASKTALQNVSASLQHHADTHVRITGYTDNTGRVDYNQTLSEKRAQSVYDYLASQGVTADRMTYEGKGVHDPIADNSTPEGRSLNRRVEIVIYFPTDIRLNSVISSKSE
ncbi:MAG: OmpA family protein [Tannerellaceae bacterium]|jgi:outer membrane protein OmpA-like peptidoglycan-associated protein|nr:OmpA family protein [Tannerellaceae bacterium]